MKNYSPLPITNPILSFHVSLGKMENGLGIVLSDQPTHRNKKCKEKQGQNNSNEMKQDKTNFVTVFAHSGDEANTNNQIAFKPEFFQAYFLQLLKLRTNCKDLSSI